MATAYQAFLPDECALGLTREETYYYYALVGALQLQANTIYLSEIKPLPTTTDFGALSKVSGDVWLTSAPDIIKKGSKTRGCGERLCSKLLQDIGLLL